MRALKPLKQQFAPPTTYGFDIETYDNNKKFLCASIYGDHFKKTFFDKQELIDELKKQRYWNTYIVATNLAFDFFGLFYKKKELNEFFTLFAGSSLKFASSFVENREFVKRPIHTARRKITFIDTLNYAGLSVKQLGSILQLPKLETPDCLGKKPKTKSEHEEMVVYNMRDAEISKKYVDFLFNAITFLGGTSKKTIGSTAMNLYRSKYLKGTYFPHKRDDLLFEFDAYFGGRTEALKRGSFKNYKYYDFNSLYPSVMINEFPDPNTLKKNSRNTIKYIEAMDGISDVTITVPWMKYPLLPLKHDGKLMFPIGTFRGKYTHLELRKAMELGCEIKQVHRCYYFTDTCRPFDDYVTDLYKMRLKYKRENNPMQQVVKLLLNSLYGKFGQKFIDKDNWVPFNLTIEELEKLDYYEVVNGFLRIKQEQKPQVFCIPAWASYITAYGRLKLHDALSYTDPIYCDTDSLITKKDLDYGNKLGELDMEMNIKEGIIVKPKFYALIDNSKNEYVKIKGLGKRISFDTFNSCLQNSDELRMEYEKFMKVKEALRRDFIPGEIHAVEKAFSLEDNKRKWDGKFDLHNLQDSDPLKITNI